MIVTGWWASLVAMGAILQIDGTVNADHMSPSQDAVGVTASVVGLGGAVAAVVVAVRWWRRPALRLTGQALTIYQRRPVAIPWTMIAEVSGPGPVGSPDGRGRRIVLVDGRELKVRGLGRLARFAARRQDPAAPVAPLGSSMRSWLSFPLPAALPVPVFPEAGQPRKRRAGQLPGPALHEVKIRFLWPPYRLILLLPLSFGFMVLVGGQSGLDVGGSIMVTLVSEAAAALMVLCCWVTLTRTVAAGPGWLAWRPQLTRRWRILALADVVSTIDLQWPRRTGVRLSRADGTGLRLRNPELATGLGPVSVRNSPNTLP